MKKDIIIIALMGVLFLLVVGSILGSFTFYKEYKDKIEYLDQQNQMGKSKVEGLESKVDSFKSTIDDISAQAKSYTDNIKTIQNTVTLSEEERKSLLAKVEEMKKDLQGWQKDYSTTVIDIRQSMLSLKDELDKIGSKGKPVELGKITVKQEEKPAMKEPETDDKQAAASGAKPGSFKPGNVRKVSNF